MDGYGWYGVSRRKATGPDVDSSYCNVVVTVCLVEIDTDINCTVQYLLGDVLHGTSCADMLDFEASCLLPL